MSRNYGKKLNGQYIGHFIDNFGGSTLRIEPSNFSFYCNLKKVMPN